MNVKISPEFWSDPEIEPLDAELKLAALWLLTNPRVNLVGYAEISEKRFCFDTGLEKQALHKAFEALPKSFRKDERGYWIRAFIRHQFGQGESLLRNNYCKPIVRDLKALASPCVVLWILDEYPELEQHVDVGSKGEALGKGLGSTTQAPEKNRTEQSSKEQLGTAGASKPKKTAAQVEAGTKGRPGDLAEVVAYFASLSAPESEAEKFHDYYEANGWRQGRAAMRSWQAAARNWVRRWRDGGAGGSKNSSGVVPPGGGLPGGTGGVCIPDEEGGES